MDRKDVVGDVPLSEFTKTSSDTMEQETDEKITDMKQKSRFKVARVGFKEKSVEIMNPEIIDEPGVKGSPLFGKDRKADSHMLTLGTDTYHNPNYDTRNLKTFGHNTLETLPHMDHYRNLLSATGAMKKRPTLLELHDIEQGDGDALLDGETVADQTKTNPPSSTKECEQTLVSGTKFGWIKGVLVRCLLNIFGVMLFLRLSWVVGHAGIGLAVIVILLAAVVTIITTLSMSAICTNGEVKGGGAYFMISRCLGPEFGGAIGIVFSVANAIAIAMYVVGFAEMIRDILAENNHLMIDEQNDVRVIGLITVCVLLAIALVGMEWESRAQLLLLAVLVIAIVNFAIGSFIPSSESEKDQGFIGYKAEVFNQNIGPEFRDGESFFSVFAIFFPAATGILAGANISGDLADAPSAIPKGTLLAIVISSITYIIMACMVGSCALRDAYGPLGEEFTELNPLGNSSFLVSNGSWRSEETLQRFAAHNGTTGNTEDKYINNICFSKVCKYGLFNDMQMMQLISAWGPITIAGIISATLSSALASLVSAPKVFQAVCKDRIFPFIHIFAKSYGRNGEPRRAYVLAFVIALGFICVGELNAIAPLISNFFLMSYALINYSCFDASLAKSPGWRPAFKYYSMWMSLTGAVLCLTVMFIINWWTALTTLAIVSFLYVYVHYRKPEINWGSSTQAHVYRNALQHTLKLVSVVDHVKNYRPQILVLSGYPSDRPALVDVAASITKNISLLVCGHIIVDKVDRLSYPGSVSRQAYQWLHKRKVKAFYCQVAADTLRNGAQSLLQCVGLGKMRANTLLLGFKTDWWELPGTDVEEYVRIIHDAFDLHYGVGVLRLGEGLDFSNISHGAVKEENSFEMNNKCSSDDSIKKVSTENSITSDPPNETPDTEQRNDLEPKQVRLESCEEEGRDEDSLMKEVQHELKNVINKEAIQNLNRFHRKQQKGTIDVWWLFDDGGLTLLIPYILSTKKQWSNCKLRVFMAGTKSKDLDRDQRNMAALLSKFRIEYSSMTVIPSIGKTPSEECLYEFNNLIEKWLLNESNGENSETHPWKISQDELSTQKDKINRHVRMRELLQEHSKNATLVVVTLPMPKRGVCCTSLYMALLDIVSRDMPPVLLLRGNQDSVLTYYS